MSAQKPNFFQKIVKTLKNEKFRPLGTCQFYYVNEAGKRTETISMTFMLGNKGSRDLKLHYKKDRYGNDPFTHPYYHSVGIPWLEMTSPFATNDQSTTDLIDKICGNVSSSSKPNRPPPGPPALPKEANPVTKQPESTSVKVDCADIDTIDRFLENSPFENVKQ